MNIYIVKNPEVYINALEYKHTHGKGSDDILIILRIKKYGIKVNQIEQMIKKENWQNVLNVNLAEAYFRSGGGWKRKIKNWYKNSLLLISLWHFLIKLKKIKKKYNEIRIICTNDVVLDAAKSALKPSEVVLVDRGYTGDSELTSSKHRVENQNLILRYFCSLIGIKGICKSREIIFTSYPGEYVGNKYKVIENSYTYHQSKFREEKSFKQKRAIFLGMPTLALKDNICALLDQAQKLSKGYELVYYAHPHEAFHKNLYKELERRGIKYIPNRLPFQIEVLHGYFKGYDLIIASHWSSSFKFLEAVFVGKINIKQL